MQISHYKKSNLNSAGVKLFKIKITKNKNKEKNNVKKRIIKCII